MTWGQTATGAQAQNTFTGGAYVAPQTSFQNYLSQGMAYAQPSLLSTQLGTNAGYRNLAYGSAGYGMDQNSLQQGYTSDSRDLALRTGQNSIDLAAAQRQPALLAQLLGLDNQDYALQHKDYGLQYAGFDIDRADAGLNARENYQNLVSDATARGSMITTGRKDRQANIYEALANQMGHIGNAEDRTHVSEDRLGISQQKNTLSATEQQAQAQDRINALNLTADRLGMQAGELRSTLDSSLAKLGLNYSISTDQLLDGIANNDLQAKQILYQVIQQAGQYATAGK